MKHSDELSKIEIKSCYLIRYMSQSNKVVSILVRSPELTKVTNQWLSIRSGNLKDGVIKVLFSEDLYKFATTPRLRNTHLVINFVVDNVEYDYVVPDPSIAAMDQLVNCVLFKIDSKYVFYTVINKNNSNSFYNTYVKLMELFLFEDKK